MQSELNLSHLVIDCLTMAMSVEAILADAQRLVLRLKEHDNSADCLITRTQSLQKQLDAMKQFQERLNELNEVARHRPRLGLIITLAQENSKIRELQSENLELRQSLSDHQSALEVIMTKYREQLANLARANEVERSLLQRSSTRQEDIEKKSEKISEMAAVLWHAASMEDRSDDAHEVIARLQHENCAMRELLQLELFDSGDASTRMDTALRPASSDVAIQTRSSADDDPFCAGNFATIRPRPPSSGNPAASATSCAAGESARNSPPPRPPNQDDGDGRSRFPPPSENSADISSDRLESSNDTHSSGDVADVDCVTGDEVGHVNSSDSLETLVNPSELDASDECL